MLTRGPHSCVGPSYGQRLRVVCTVMLLSTLIACSHAPQQAEVDERAVNVGQRLLTSEGGGGSAGDIQTYALGETEGFRMPEALHAPSPVLAESFERQSLPPTTVCAQVIIDAAGKVERVDAILDRVECEAGSNPELAALLQVVTSAVTQWQFRPAAICHFAPGVRTNNPYDCSGSIRSEDVPVTLLYAFTFEVIRGKARVHVDNSLRK